MHVHLQILIFILGLSLTGPTKAELAEPGTIKRVLQQATEGIKIPFVGNQQPQSYAAAIKNIGCKGTGFVEKVDGSCSISNGINCRYGARESILEPNSIDCVDSNGKFQIYDQNGKLTNNIVNRGRYEEFEKTSSSTNRDEPISNSTSSPEMTKNTQTFQLRESTTDLIGKTVIDANQNTLMPAGALGCEKITQNSTGNLECYKKNQLIATVDPKKLKEDVDLEKIAEHMSIDLCALAHAESAGRKIKEKSKARNSSLIQRTFGTGTSYKFSEESLSVSLSRRNSDSAFAYWKTCEANGRACKRILVKSEGIDCEDSNGRVTQLQSSDQSRDLRVDLLKKEVFNTEKNNVSLEKLLTASSYSKSFLKIEKPIITFTDNVKNNSIRHSHQGID